MTRKDDSKIIRIVHPICCGLDFYKESVSACVIFPDDKGEEQYEVKVSDVSCAFRHHVVPSCNA